VTLIFRLTGQCLSGKNHMQIGRNGKHYPLPRWAAWRDEQVIAMRHSASRQVVSGHRLPLTGYLKATVSLTHADKHKRDVPGLLDALCHVLERAGVVTDDSQIVQWDVSTNLPPCKELAGVNIKLETRTESDKPPVGNEP